MTMALTALLHLCDSLFPIGSFAYSDGLEWAVNRGLVTDADDLGGWLAVCLDENFGCCDGPAVAKTWLAVRDEDWSAVIAIDQECTALRPSLSMRTASRSMGLRLLKTWSVVRPDGRLDRASALVADRVLAPTFPVAFATVAVCADIPMGDALIGYAYGRLAATVSAAMRVMAIGQTESHQLLGRVLSRVPAVADAVASRGSVPESFSPALDVAQMSQQYLGSRLFRS
jgi:urease accessory protein